MLGETLLSARNERRLRARGAVEPAADVIGAMQWAYPGAFVAMAIDGAITDPPPLAFVVAGGAVFLLAKGLKYWAIATLGERWTFRVLVPPDSVRVRSGPYARLSHPNYVAVVGELIGFQMLLGALLAGPIALLGFVWLLRRRIEVEERALGGRPPGGG